MKIKHSLAAIFVGFSLGFLGALFKIMHYAFADALIITGTVLKVVGGILFLYKLSTYPKIREFLNW